MSPAEVLRKAADVIRERGHHKGDYEGPDGSVCMFGAVRVVSGLGTGGFQDDDPEDETAFIYAALEGYGVEGFASDWNDAPERTADDVIAALLKAAELAEGK